MTARKILIDVDLLRFKLELQPDLLEEGFRSWAPRDPALGLESLESDLIKDFKPLETSDLTAGLELLGLSELTVAFEPFETSDLSPDLKTLDS